MVSVNVLMVMSETQIISVLQHQDAQATVLWIHSDVVSVIQVLQHKEINASLKFNVLKTVSKRMVFATAMMVTD